MKYIIVLLNTDLDSSFHYSFIPLGSKGHWAWILASEPDHSPQVSSWALSRKRGTGADVCPHQDPGLYAGEIWPRNCTPAGSPSVRGGPDQEEEPGAAGEAAWAAPTRHGWLHTRSSQLLNDLHSLAVFVWVVRFLKNRFSCVQKRWRSSGRLVLLRKGLQWMKSRPEKYRWNFIIKNSFCIKI